MFKLRRVVTVIFLSLLIVSCSPKVVENISPTRMETQLVKPSHTPLPSQTFTPSMTFTSTREPTTTRTAIPSATQSPSRTATANFPQYYVDECIPKDTLVQKGKVIEIIDGDTINVQLEDGGVYRLRYIGIDAPENNSPFSEQSTAANSNLVLDKEVILVIDVSNTDAYSRLLRYVIVDNIFINYELARLGMAGAVEDPPDISCSNAFHNAENQARSHFMGIWVATPTPVSAVLSVVIVEVNKRAEYVDISNTGKVDVDLTGWRLVSEKGNQECQLHGTIRVGETMRIWAQAGDGGISCGYGSPIWNNSEPDPAVLYNPQGVEVSRK